MKDEAIARALSILERRDLSLGGRGSTMGRTGERFDTMDYQDHHDESPCPHPDDEQGWSLWVEKNRRKRP